MRVSDFQVHELLALEFRLDSGSGSLDGGTETNTDEAENSAVAFTDAENVILQVCAGGSCLELASLSAATDVVHTPHSLLLLVCRILY